MTRILKADDMREMKVEHLQTINHADIRKMRKNDIFSSFFITHIYYFADIHKAKFLGPECVKNLEPIRWAEDEKRRYAR